MTWLFFFWNDENNLFSSATLNPVLYLSIGFSSLSYRFQYSHRNQSEWKKAESRKIVALSKRLSTHATTSKRQIM